MAQPTPEEQTPAGPPSVSVAVVSWNTREHLLRCLESLAAEVEAGVLEVWVVDNDSSDGSAAAARTAAPWAHVIESGENLGFGRAVNLVALRTRSPWLGCANADIAAEPGAVTTMLQAGRDQRVGCVAPRLILPDGSAEHTIHSLPTIPFALALNLGLPRLSPRLAERLCLPGRAALDRPRAVPWAIGAFLLLRRAAFDAVGGFDERQWMYAEDLDLGWRLHDAGWLTWYEPRAVVRHVSGAATSVAFGEDRRSRFMRATYGVILRRHGRVRTWITAMINVLGAAARVAWMRPAALVLPRFRGLAAENHRWALAHLEGLRSASRLLDPD